MEMENDRVFAWPATEMERAVLWLWGYKNHIMIKLYPERKPYSSYVNYAHTCRANALNSYKVAHNKFMYYEFR